MYRTLMAATWFILAATTVFQVRILPDMYVNSFRIREFVNTREPIWVYKTSTRSRVRCKFDKMRSIQPTFIVFNRTLLYSGQRTSVEMRGIFSTRNTNRMYTMHAGQLIGIESLYFKALDSSCAVIVVHSFTERGTVYVDLRIRNSAVRAGPTATCTREFSRFARHGGSVIYSPNCSQELRNALM